MIVPMKKITLFMSEADLKTQLQNLGDLGMLHISPYQPAEDESIHLLNTQMKKLEDGISILSNLDLTLPLQNQNRTHSLNPNESNPDFQPLSIDQVLQINDQILQENDTLKTLEHAKQWFHLWGNVSHNEILLLKDKGIYFTLYLLKEEPYKKVSSQGNIITVGKVDQQYQVILFSYDPNEKLPYDEVSFPEYDPDQIPQLIDQSTANRKELLMKMEHASLQLDHYKTEYEILLNKHAIQTVQFSGLDLDSKVRYWKGYIPKELIPSFISTADQEHWGYLIQDPEQEELDEVPTLIRNTKWVSWIKPVMNFMGLVPGYREIDVSQIFMIFFTFFTGILVGDAGYGLIFFLLTLFVHRKKGFKPQIEISLFYTLSASVMFWGIITGTYFGSQQIAEIPFLSQFIVQKIATYGGDSIFLQKFVFTLGAIHLSIGHLQTAFKYLNSVKALAQIGWVAIVWGLYLLVLQMILKEPNPNLMLWCFIGGTLLVALFSNPGPRFFKGIFSSLANLPLSMISGFSDVISYIRLYAVGLSTVLMASSFNEMAIGEGITTVLAGVGAVLVLILGHGLNMVLAAMAVIVHGVRLNMLEYAGHAGVEFSGNEYNPFKINKKTNKNSTK